MRCEDVMKREVHWVSDSDTAQEAAKKMREQNIGFLPVCDSTGNLVGTITDRDIAVRVVAEDLSASECLVSDAMTREIICCRPGDDLAEAERLMGRYHKSRVIVSDDGRRLRGVISLSDVAARDSLRRAAATLREVSSREARL